jgi:hypothetical protein
MRRCARGLGLKTTVAEGASQPDVAAFYIYIDWMDLQGKLRFSASPGVRIGSVDGCSRGERGCAIHGATGFGCLYERAARSAARNVHASEMKGDPLAEFAGIAIAAVGLNRSVELYVTNAPNRLV